MNRKRILVFGDSNSWGFVPCNANELTTRYDAFTRWPAAMAARLGSGFELVEEALSGRTTDLDDAQIDLPSAHLRGAVFNGAKILPALLASHLPLDLVIIMLGTNDLKTRFKRNANEIAIAALGLARLIVECEGVWRPAIRRRRCCCSLRLRLEQSFTTPWNGLAATKKAWSWAPL